LLDGLKEPSCQLVALRARGLEAGLALLDVASGAGGELAHVVLALAHDRRDLRIPVVEHLVKQQHGSLLDRLWQPLPDIALATGARGAQLVDRQPGGHGGGDARGDAICSPPSSA
jgi:hypothetical protein